MAGCGMTRCHITADHWISWHMARCHVVCLAMTDSHMTCGHVRALLWWCRFRLNGDVGLDTLSCSALHLWQNPGLYGWWMRRVVMMVMVMGVLWRHSCLICSICLGHNLRLMVVVLLGLKLMLELVLDILLLFMLMVVMVLLLLLLSLHLLSRKRLCLGVGSLSVDNGLLMTRSW